MRNRDSFKEQKGYFTFAQNNDTTDYLTLAYAQALSVKCTQKINSFAVAVDYNTKQQITDKHRKVFDYIIDIPEDLAAHDSWKLKNEWKAWHLTPFKETIKIESDILLTRSIDHWWSGMQNSEICLTSKILDYEGNVSNNRAYRKLFDDNLLPDVYNGFMYFRFGKDSLKFFLYAQHIFENWDLYRTKVLNNCRDPEPTTDVVYAIAASMIGVEKCINPVISYPTFVHMKGAINGFETNADWTTKLYAQLDDELHLTVGFTRQQYPFHYQNKKFITPEIIEKYEQQFARQSV